MTLASRAVSFALLFAPLLVFSTFAQEAAPQSAATSVVQAASQARLRAADSAAHPRIITNDDLPADRPATGTSAYSLPSPQAAHAQFAEPQQDTEVTENTACYNPIAAQAISAQLQAAEDQRTQLDQYLSSQQPVISGNNFDLRSYQPGYSGIYVGSAPLQESQPEAPARIDIATLDEQIASLENSRQLACDPPEAAVLQQKLDTINASLAWSHRELALDQDTFYSNPNYSRDSKGQAYLAAQQDHIAALVSEKDLLTQQLAILQPDAAATEPSSPTPTRSAPSQPQQ